MWPCGRSATPIISPTPPAVALTVGVADGDAPRDSVEEVDAVGLTVGSGETEGEPEADTMLEPLREVVGVVLSSGEVEVDAVPSVVVEVETAGVCVGVGEYIEGEAVFVADRDVDTVGSGVDAGVREIENDGVGVPVMGGVTVALVLDVDPTEPVGEGVEEALSDSC